MRLIVPYPPSVNHYWRRVGRRTLISRQGRAFRQAVEQIVWRAHGLRGWQPYHGPLRVEVALHPPDRRRRDLDNSLKALLDALQHAGVYEDDSQIVSLAIEKRKPMDGGMAVVQIETLNDGEGRTNET